MKYISLKVRARNSEANNKEEPTARLDCELCRYVVVISHLECKDVITFHFIQGEVCPWNSSPASFAGET